MFSLLSFFIESIQKSQTQMTADYGVEFLVSSTIIKKFAVATQIAQEFKRRW